jgi:hypothetical protein
MHEMLNPDFVGISMTKSQDPDPDEIEIQGNKRKM